MPESVRVIAPSAEFDRAVASLRSAAPRRELAVSEIGAPTGLAPHSFALAADVTPARHDADSDLGTGRFILLHDPTEPDAWRGAFRVVCFSQAPLETDIGVDPFVARVAWSWLIDSLEARGAAYHSLSGTATKILSTGFGELAEQGDGAQIELRASWTPSDAEMGRHVEGWAEMLCLLAGLPPMIEGVAMLSTRRAGRE